MNKKFGDLKTQTKPRRSIGNALKFKVLKRDGFRCAYCGKPAGEVELEIDHITPFSRGGTNDIDNLQASCFECNRGKHTKSPIPTPKDTKKNTEKYEILTGELKESSINGLSKVLEMTELLIDETLNSMAPKFEDMRKAGALKQDEIESLISRGVLEE